MNDLYFINQKDYISQNADLKKLSKDIQKQRYNKAEEERKKKIQNCIKKRQEIIKSSQNPEKTNKINPKLKNIYMLN